jgi:NAD(P)H dehydrogenase (quinone)
MTFTLGGQPHMFGAHAIHGELNAMLGHLLRGTLGYVGFKVLEPFVGYHLPCITAEERNAIMKRFRHDVRNVAWRPSLSFPSLDDFDARLHPLSPPPSEQASGH